MTKKKAGRKLNPMEAEEYFKDKFDKEFEKLKKETNFEGVPSHA
jgi:hypothetical protein